MLTDDSTSLTGELAQTLTERGLQVVVISFLQSLTVEASFPPEINRVVIEDNSEAQLQLQLKEIASQYGSIAALIHLHPQLQQEESHSMLKQLFLLAKHLKTSLNKASQSGSCFFTVAHLDGELGVSGKGFDPVTGGLFGLTKSLRWEWSSVFCRAIDLGRDLDASTSVKHIISELHDPNRLIAEVGYSREGRTTLVGVRSQRGQGSEVRSQESG